MKHFLAVTEENRAECNPFKLVSKRQNHLRAHYQRYQACSMRTHMCHDCRFVKCCFQPRRGACETCDFPFLQEVRLTGNTSNRLGCVNLQGSATKGSTGIVSLLG